MLGRKFGWIFAVSPILGIYMIGVPFLSLSQILLICMSVFCIVRVKKTYKVYFKAFIAYAIIISLFRFAEPWVIIGDCIHDILSLVLFFFILSSLITYADYEIFKRTIIKLGVVSLAFFLLQYTLSLFGIRISGIIPFMPLANGVPTSTFINTQIGRERLSGLFQEPAHYAEFMVIVLIFILFSSMKNLTKISLATLVSLSILMSNSASGFAMLIVIWSIWLFVFHLKSSKHKALYLIIMIAVVFVIIVIAVNNESIMMMAGRVSELSGETETAHGRSTYIRVVRGYIPFMEGSFIDQIFGNGLGTIMSYVKGHPQSDYLLLTDFNPRWINGLQYLLFSTGIFGCILYFSQILWFSFRTSSVGRALTIYLILLFLSSDSFFSVDMVLYAIIMEMFVTKNKKYSNDFSCCTNI